METAITERGFELMKTKISALMYNTPISHSIIRMFINSEQDLIRLSLEGNIRVLSMVLKGSEFVVYVELVPEGVDEVAIYYKQHQWSRLLQLLTSTFNDINEKAINAAIEAEEYSHYKWGRPSEVALVSLNEQAINCGLDDIYPIYSVLEALPRGSFVIGNSGSNISIVFANTGTDERMDIIFGLSQNENYDVWLVNTIVTETKVKAMVINSADKGPLDMEILAGNIHDCLK